MVISIGNYSLPSVFYIIYLKLEILDLTLESIKNYQKHLKSIMNVDFNLEFINK